MVWCTDSGMIASETYGASGIIVVILVIIVMVAAAFLIVIAVFAM